MHSILPDTFARISAQPPQSRQPHFHFHKNNTKLHCITATCLIAPLLQCLYIVRCVCCHCAGFHPEPWITSSTGTHTFHTHKTPSERSTLCIHFAFPGTAKPSHRPNPNLPQHPSPNPSSPTIDQICLSFHTGELLTLPQHMSHKHRCQVAGTCTASPAHNTTPSHASTGPTTSPPSAQHNRHPQTHHAGADGALLIRWHPRQLLQYLLILRLCPGSHPTLLSRNQPATSTNPRARLPEVVYWSSTPFRGPGLALARPLEYCANDPGCVVCPNMN